MVGAAVEQVFERLSPGIKGSEMDSAAREYIDQHGFGNAFTHSLGHGVGLRVHEAPSFSKKSEDILAPGNIVTVEPGVYLPEWGGVRVEDVVLMTEDGFEVLTTASKKHIQHQHGERKGTQR
jgi:Xaa-Pro aminopeptidase